MTYNDDGTAATSVDQRGWTTTYTYDDALRVTAEAVTGSGLVGTSAVAYAYRCVCQVVCGRRGFSSLSLTNRS